MKTARFLLACAVASVLAACGTDPITAPASSDAPRGAPSAPSGDVVTCVKITIVQPDGTSIEVCAEDKSSQMGTGN